MQIRPASAAFTLLLGFLAAVPYSSIDINVPSLAATAAAFGANTSDVGLTMSAFMVSLAVAPIFYGPVSDRLGRKPVLLFGVALFVVASLACAAAQSLPVFMICRFVQGAGAASTTVTFAIIRDLFGGASARAKIGKVLIAVNVMTVIAPSAGAGLLTLGNWRLVYLTQAGIGIMLSLAVLVGLTESAGLDHGGRLLAAAAKSYLRVLTHPVSMPYIVVGAISGATVFAYVTGSSLFFIEVARLPPGQYGLIFSGCSAAVMSGAFLDGRLGHGGISPARVVMIGLAVSAAAASILLLITLAGWTPPGTVATLLMVVAFAFGMIMPNVMNATMQPLPDIAGAVGATAGSIQMVTGAASSELVATLFDGRSALSMSTVMAACSLLGLIAHWQFVRPVERRVSRMASNS